MSDIYRQAASILLLRKAADGSGQYQFLLLHKPRKRDAWQLPQGGVEKGENVREAALRELKEEAGIAGCRVFGQSAQVYQYDFPASFRRFRPDNVCGQHIAYVFALCEGSPEVCVDQKEIDGFLWINLSELPGYIRRKEYISIVEALHAEALALLAKNVSS